MKCRDIFCDSRSYLEDGQCHSKNASDSVGSCITVFVKLSFSPNKGSNSYYELILMFNDHMQLVKQELLKELLSLLEEFALFSKRVTTETDQRYLILQMKFYVLDRDRTVTFSQLIDSFENKSLTIKVGGHSETFESQIIGYSLYAFGNSTIQNIEVPNDDTTSFDIIERLPISEHALVRSPCYSGSYPFNKLDVCPFIQLEHGELPFEGTNRLLIINESFLFQILEYWEFKQYANHLSICFADYKKVYDAMPWGIAESDNFELAVGAKDTFSLVCVCLSVVCLLVTIITYVALTELHSQPGINTIILCVTLLLAQTIYQFGAGQTDGPKWSCVVIGAVCHFLWLSVMLAMNVCSYDMFRIFKNIQKLPTNFRWTDIIKRLSYIFVGSVLFVVINFVLSLSLSDGEDFGYGGFICYLSSTRMHLITFIIPSLFTIITNFALFGYVVFKIGQNRVHAAKLGHEKNYFGIYARLSTLTGLTWLVGYLQLLIKNEILEYQFILLNAGQGVFIMFAFVCNRRIYGLIKDKLSIRKGSTD